MWYSEKKAGSCRNDQEVGQMAIRDFFDNKAKEPEMEIIDDRVRMSVCANCGTTISCAVRGSSLPACAAMGIFAPAWILRTGLS